MTETAFAPDPSIALFVKSSTVFEEHDAVPRTVLPFYADGYPGLIAHQTEGGLRVHPHNKQMPALFLYGQTIQPVELELAGRFRMLVVQLYPFVLPSLFGVVPAELNDGCYDLDAFAERLGADTKRNLDSFATAEAGLEAATVFLQEAILQKQQSLDQEIAAAVQRIIADKGQTSIGALCKELFLTGRTFERRFRAAVGVGAKQFATMIRFQSTLAQLHEKEAAKLTDIVYAHGFADQSHFIKVFKTYTGKTPSAFRAKA